MHRRNLLVLLSVVILASGCTSSQETSAEIEDKIQSSSFTYDAAENPALATRTGEDTIESTLEYQVDLSENDSDYGLNPGLNLKIFDNNGDRLKSEIIADERTHSFYIKNLSIPLNKNKNLTACLTTKEFDNKNSWNIEERENSEVYCQDYRISKPEISLEVSPKTARINYTRDSPSTETRDYSVENTGEVGVRISPRFDNGKTVFNTGESSLQLAFMLLENSVLMPNETLEHYILFQSRKADKNRNQIQLDKKAYIVAGANNRSDINSSIKNYPFKIEVN
jgi:hypothetical protein